jgi:hypothetical protein
MEFSYNCSNLEFCKWLVRTKTIHSRLVLENAHGACVNGHLDSLLFLISEGFDINKIDSSVIIEMMRNRHFYVIKMLVSNGYDIRKFVNEFKMYGYQHKPPEFIFFVNQLI